MDSIWLYLEPFTFISEDETHYLFYNSRDKNNLSIPKKGMVRKTTAGYYCSSHSNLP